MWSGMQHVTPYTQLLKQRHAAASLLLGSMLVLVPVLGHIVLSGWAVRVHRAVVAGEAMPALGLDDLSGDARLGLGPFVVQMIMGLVLCLVFLPLLVLPGVVFSIALPALADSDISEEGAIAIFVVGVLVFVLVGLVCLYLLVMATHAALISAELGDSVSDGLAGLRPGRLRAFFKLVPRELFGASIGLAMGSSLLVLAGLLLLTLGVYPATVMVFAAGAHYRAQVYEIYLARGGPPIPSRAGAPAS
jgi:hypothetical protein